MAAEIGLLSVTQIQKLSQSQHHHQNQPHQPNPNSPTTLSTLSSSTWMWNPREHQEEDDSWEVRAFAEDTRNIMGTTWPPRSYTCTFCRREFRSAQALGGHMNVHRRDRARLHHHQPHPPPNPTSSSHPTSSSFINIPPQELVANGGLCLLYHLPTSPNNAPLFSTHNLSTTLNACGKSPSTLLNVSPNPPNYRERNVHTAEETPQIMSSKNKHLSLERICEEQNIPQANLMMMPTCSPSFDFPMAQAASNGFSSYCCSSSKVEEPTTSSTNHGHHEELDLELRLGHRSTPT